MNCDLPGLFVQPRNGIAGLADGKDRFLFQGSHCITLAIR